MEQILYILTRGLIIGVFISAPMGPIGMLVIQRTLSKGRWPAFFTGLGAALSDLVYCLMSGFCLSLVTDIIDTHKLAIQLVGSAVIAVFGLYLFKKNPTRALRAAAVNASNCWSDFATGFLFTFSNPLILFFIIGLFARFTFLQPEYRLHHYLIAFTSIFVGAVAWWYAVTLAVDRLRRRINVRFLRLINAVIGSLLILMALGGIAMSILEMSNV